MSFIVHILSGEFLHLTLSLMIVGIMFSFGLILVLYSHFKCRLNEQFVEATRCVSCAYFAVAALFVIERIGNFADNNLQFVFLFDVLGALQTLFVGHALCIILDKQHITFSRAVTAMVLVLTGLATLGIIGLKLNSEELYNIAFHILTVSYSMLVLYYVTVILKQVLGRDEVVLSDGYKIRRISFYVILGWMVFMYVLMVHFHLFPNYMHLLIAFAFISFYIYFGIAYLNKSMDYTRFLQMQLIFEQYNNIDEPAADVVYLSTVSERRLNNWVDEKAYVISNFTIESLAKQIGTNRTYLSLYINQQYDVSFSQWITNLRLKEAKIILLEHPKKSVEEVAFNTGFSSKSYFIRIFQKEEGMTPCQWKSIHLSGEVVKND